MTITEERKKEALQLMQKVTENQWSMIQNLVSELTKEPIKKENVSASEKLEKEKEALLSISEDNLSAWKEKNLKGLHIPERYEMTIMTVKPILEYAARINPDREAIWNSLDAMYSYGFKRGMSYQKAHTKKKAALHAANMKNGIDHPTNEI